MRLKTKIALGIMLLLVAGLLQCGGGEAPAPPPPPADEAKKEPPKGKTSKPKKETKADKDEELPALVSKEKGELLKAWRYNPEAKWDPFIVPEIETGGTPLIPAAKYELDQMFLYGIVRGSGMDRAFLRLPDGTDLIVKINDVIGKHQGRVVEITANSIVVEERYYDSRRPDEIFVIRKELPLVKLMK